MVATDARRGRLGSSEAAVAMALVLRKLLREYVLVTVLLPACGIYAELAI
jgi:hypothetical protein